MSFKKVKSSSERKCTNVPALVFAIMFIFITVILVACCGVFAYRSGNWKFNDSNEVKELKDSCGYICGQKNLLVISSSCMISDMTELPKIVTEFIIPSMHERIVSKNHSVIKHCFDKCPEGSFDISNECIEGGSMSKMVEELKITWHYILIICLVAFVFSYVCLLLIRHAAIYVIWIIYLSFVVLIIGLAIFFAVNGVLKSAISFGVFGLILVIVLYCMRKKISLVAKLFKEASKALTDVPSVMFEPILTFVSLLISFLIFATFAVIISYADEDEPLKGPAYICNLISFIFITQFIIGCQNFIIAGTVCRWYFTRDKTKLRKPVRKSFSHLFKFHLGSVCFSAILMTLIKIIKIIISYLKNSAKNNKNTVVYLFDMIDKLLLYLVRNAYIVIAKEGTPFCESGRRAYRLLMNNITDVVALNHFGDFVLFVCRLLIVMIAGSVGYTVLSQNISDPDHIFIPMIFGCILAFLIAHCFVMVFEMTVDIIFISFCIDLEENDGQIKPYYMSDSLRKIIGDMKDQKEGTNNMGPKRDPVIRKGTYESNEMHMLPQQKQPAYQPISYCQQQQYPQIIQPYPQQHK